MMSNYIQKFNRWDYGIEKYFSQGIIFILNKTLRRDPIMRYLSDDLMNDSWIISGPLITEQSYFAVQLKNNLLSKSLGGRNKTTIATKRPHTSVNNKYLSEERCRPLTVNYERIGNQTQYKGFEIGRIKRSIDNTSKNSTNSINAGLRYHKIYNLEKSFNGPSKEINLEQNLIPEDSYFKTRIKRNKINHPSKNTSVRSRHVEDTYWIEMKYWRNKFVGTSIPMNTIKVQNNSK